MTILKAQSNRISLDADTRTTLESNNSFLLKSFYYGPTLVTSGTSAISFWSFVPLSYLSLSGGTVSTSTSATPSDITLKTKYEFTITI